MTNRYRVHFFTKPTIPALTPDNVRRKCSEIISDETGSTSDTIVKWIFATLIFIVAFFLVWHFVVGPRFEIWMRDTYSNSYIYNVENEENIPENILPR